MLCLDYRARLPQTRTHRLLLECIAEWSSRHAQDMPQAAMAAQALANDKHVEFPPPVSETRRQGEAEPAPREGDDARRRRLLALESRLQVRTPITTSRVHRRH